MQELLFEISENNARYDAALSGAGEPVQPLCSCSLHQPPPPIASTNHCCHLQTLEVFIIQWQTVAAAPIGPGAVGSARPGTDAHIVQYLLAPQRSSCKTSQQRLGWLASLAPEESLPFLLLAHSGNLCSTLATGQEGAFSNPSCLSRALYGATRSR